jgi:FkbM family methyltransferase
MIKKTNARHGDFYIFTNDIFISRCLDLYGEWSEAEMVVYETFIQKEHIVIEVGSHIGSFTVPIARLAKSVFAFEPQRTVFQVLNTNLITNGIHNVYSYMHAVGKEDKHLWLKEVEYEAGTMEKGFNSGGINLKQISAENNGYPCKQITLEVKSLASSLSYLYEGHKVLELAACGLKLEACCSTLDACRLHLEQLGA